MSETIEQKCLAKGVKLTEQRKTIAKIMSDSQDHPDVDELYRRASKIDSKISIATVYRTVKLFFCAMFSDRQGLVFLCYFGPGAVQKDAGDLWDEFPPSGVQIRARVSEL